MNGRAPGPHCSSTASCPRSSSVCSGAHLERCADCSAFTERVAAVATAVRRRRSSRSRTPSRCPPCCAAAHGASRRAGPCTSTAAAAAVGAFALAIGSAVSVPGGDRLTTAAPMVGRRREHGRPQRGSGHASAAARAARVGHQAADVVSAASLRPGRRPVTRLVRRQSVRCRRAAEPRHRPLLTPRPRRQAGGGARRARPAPAGGLRGARAPLDSGHFVRTLCVARGHLRFHPASPPGEPCLSSPARRTSARSSRSRASSSTRSSPTACPRSYTALEIDVPGPDGSSTHAGRRGAAAPRRRPRARRGDGLHRRPRARHRRRRHRRADLGAGRRRDARAGSGT